MDFHAPARSGFLVGGSAFSAGLLFLAWSLPSGGISEKISDLWYQATGPWQTVQGHFDRLFASLNAPEDAARGLGFGRTLAPRASFELGERPVLLVNSKEGRYWRAATYDRYTGQVFTSTEATSIRVEARDPQLSEYAKYDKRVDIEQRVRILAPQATSIFAADSPVKMSQPTLYDYRRQPEDFASLRLASPLRKGQEYAVVSSVSVASVADLRAAGEDYPAWIRRYRFLPRSVPSRVRNLAQQLTATARNNYDKATAIESYLRRFTYTTKTKIPPPDRDWVDYMLFDSKEGYCDYYAAAMSVLLRAIGVPARVASGFATGDFDPSLDAFIVRESHAHSWTEVFFPGYGWITFEPSAIRPIPARPEVPTSGSAGGDLLGLDDEFQDEDDFWGEGVFGVRPGGEPAILRFIMDALGKIGILLLAMLFVAGVLASARVLSWRHSLKDLESHARYYAQMCRLGSWFGLKPRPAQTPFEYAAQMSSQIPAAREHVSSIAEYYVQGTYSSREPAEALQERAAQSWERLRHELPREASRHNWRYRLKEALLRILSGLQP